MEDIQIILVSALVLIGGALGYFLRKIIVSKKAQAIEQIIKKQLEEAKSKSSELILKAQERAADLLGKAAAEEKERKGQLLKTEERLVKKEEILERQSAEIRTKDEQNQALAKELETTKNEIANLKNEVIAQLEKISGFSKDEAKEVILRDTRERYQKELVQSLEKIFRNYDHGDSTFKPFSCGRRNHYRF